MQCQLHHLTNMQLHWVGCHDCYNCQDTSAPNTTHAAGHALMRIGLIFQLFKNAETHVRPCLACWKRRRCCAYHKALEGWLIQASLQEDARLIRGCSSGRRRFFTLTCGHYLQCGNTCLQDLNVTLCTYVDHEAQLCSVLDPHAVLTLHNSRHKTLHVLSTVLHVSMIAYCSVFNVGRPLIEVVTPRNILGSSCKRQHADIFRQRPIAQFNHQNFARLSSMQVGTYFEYFH